MSQIIGYASAADQHDILHPELSYLQAAQEVGNLFLVAGNMDFIAGLHHEASLRDIDLPAALHRADQDIDHILAVDFR